MKRLATSLTVAAALFCSTPAWGETLPALSLDTIHIPVKITAAESTYAGFTAEQVVTSSVRLQVEDYREDVALSREQFGYQVAVEKPGGCLFSSNLGASVASALSDEGKAKAARLYYTQKEYNKAISTLREIPQKSPLIPLALYLEALSMRALGYESRALELLGQARQYTASPVAREASLALAIAWYNLGNRDYIGAIEQFVAGREWDAIDATPRLLWLNALLDKGHYERVLQLTPSFRQTNFAESALYVEAQATQKLGDTAGALAIYAAMARRGERNAIPLAMETAFELREYGQILEFAKLAELGGDTIDNTTARYATWAAAHTGALDVAKRWFERISLTQIQAYVAYQGYQLASDDTLRRYFAESLLRVAPAEKRAEARLLLTEYFINAGQTDAGWKSLSAIDEAQLDKDQRPQYHLFNLILLNQRQGYLSAQRHIQAGDRLIRRQHPLYHLWLYQKAITYNGIGNLDLAAKFYAEVPKESPYASNAQLNLAHIHGYNGKYAAAETIYLALLSANPTDETVRRSLVKLYNGWGKFEEALRFSSTGGVADSPQRALAHFKLGEFGQALEHYQICAQHFSDSAPGAACRYYQALSAFNLRRYADVAKILNDAMPLFERHTEYRQRAFVLLGDAAYNQGKYEFALQAFSRVSDGKFHLGLLNTLIQLEKVEEAEKYLLTHEATLVDEIRTNAIAFLAESSGRAGDMPRAHRYYVRLGDEGSIIRLGRLYMERGEMVPALLLFAEYQARYPALRFFTGRIFYEQGEYANAYAELRTVLEHPTYGVDARKLAAEASIHMKKPDVALLVAHAAHTRETAMLADALPILIEQEQRAFARTIAQELLFTYLQHRPLAAYAFAWSYEEEDIEKAILEHLKVTYLYENTPYAQQSNLRLYELYLRTGQTDKAERVKPKQGEQP